MRGCLNLVKIVLSNLSLHLSANKETDQLSQDRSTGAGITGEPANVGAGN